MENPIKMGWFGGEKPPFSETPISFWLNLPLHNFLSIHPPGSHTGYSKELSDTLVVRKEGVKNGFFRLVALNGGHCKGGAPNNLWIQVLDL